MYVRKDIHSTAPSALLISYFTMHHVQTPDNNVTSLVFLYTALVIIIHASRPVPLALW